MSTVETIQTVAEPEEESPVVQQFKQRKSVRKSVRKSAARMSLKQSSSSSEEESNMMQQAERRKSVRKSVRKEKKVSPFRRFNNSLKVRLAHVSSNGQPYIDKILAVLLAIYMFVSRPIRSYLESLEPRRKQKLALIYHAIPKHPFALWIMYAALKNKYTAAPMLLYVYWSYFLDESAVTGTRSPWLKGAAMWKHFCDYFPLRLVKTAELDPKGKYVFGYHPHGVIGIGAVGNFATDGTGFADKFPGIDLRLLTLPVNFKFPLVRELLLWMGLCSSSKRSCNNLLQRGPGSAIMLVIGGAAESLDTYPGTYRLTLSRQGFVRVALDNHADLVPVVGYGENDVYDILESTPKTRAWQNWMKAKLGWTLPNFSGRGFLMPFRRPITVVVGAPIELPKLPKEQLGQALFETEEGRALVDEYHAKYIVALRKLFDEQQHHSPVETKEPIQIVDHHKIRSKID